MSPAGEGSEFTSNEYTGTAAGEITPSGAVSKLIAVAAAVSGAISPSGSITRRLQLYRTKTGEIEPDGDTVEGYKEALFFGVSNVKDPTGIDR